MRNCKVKGQNARSFIVKVLALLLVLGAWHSPADARTLPAGSYSLTGRIVKMADGQLAVFWGRGRYLFSREEQKKLANYLGRIVQVDYVRSSDKEAGVTTPSGSVIKNIMGVEPGADNPAALPVAVAVALPQQRFAFQEPIRATVTLTNLTPQDITLHLYIAGLSLNQDYREVTQLEPDTHYNDPHPYGNPKLERLHTLPAGQTLRFTIISPRMVEPGHYQLVYALRVGKDFALALSPTLELEIQEPAVTAK